VNAPLFRHPVRDLASKFLREHADGAPLFPAGAFSSSAALARRARKLDDWAGDRAGLAAFLASENEPLGTSSLHAAQSAALVAAARPDSLFVLTGQQPGLLGGPALALHKAMTAVAWARASAERLQRPVIPIFWIAGDDSDLAESNAAEFLEPGAATTSVTLPFAQEGEAIPMSVRVLDQEACDALLASLPTTWSAAARARVAAAYRPGRSLTSAFRAVMQDLLGDEGVLFVDGFNAAQRPEAQMLLRRVAENAGPFEDALLRGTSRLRETLGLAAQVPVRPGAVRVFLFEHHRRTRLFASDSGRIYAAGAEETDLRPALADKILLHSALSRPLVVETLFPALGHVLGPAELRYFAQLADVFPVFGHSFPLVAPRQQALLVPQSGLHALSDLGFRVEDLTDLRPSRVRAQLTEQAWRAHPAAQDFPTESYARFRASLESYEASRFPGAGNRFDAARRRLDRAFGLHRDAARALVFAESAATRFAALQPLLRWLGGGSQDRHLNTLSLWNAWESGGAGGFSAYLSQLADTGDVASVFIADSFEGEAS
jgi:bacillithiol biosynthesis cysteine-adding enzyme BshC